MYRIERVDGASMAGALVEMDRLLFDTSSRIDPRTGWWWIVWREEEVCGYAGMVKSHQWEQVGYFNRAGVLPDHRGHGLQRRLIWARVLQARRLGFTHVVTDTTANPPSANNLIECGFRMYLPRYPWAFAASCYWIRKA